MSNEIKPNIERSLSKGFANSAKRTLQIDLEQYQHYLDNAGLTDEQKEEYLRSMWHIVMTFVELGYGVSPVQNAVENGSWDADGAAKSAFDMVRSEQSKDEQLKKKSGPEGRLEAK